MCDETVVSCVLKKCVAQIWIARTRLPSPSLLAATSGMRLTSLLLVANVAAFHPHPTMGRHAHTAMHSLYALHGRMPWTQRYARAVGVVLRGADYEYDASARRAARLPGPDPTSLVQPNAPNSSTITRALKEFVQSDYARQLCKYCNVNPPDHGTIQGLFVSVRLRGSTLDVKLTTAVEHKYEDLLERLATTLRANTPQGVDVLLYERNGSWGTTRTWRL